MEDQKVVSAVRPESATSQFPTIMIEQIFATRSGNKEGMNIQFRWTTEPRTTGQRGLVSKFLGKLAAPNSPEKRVALQFFGNDVIEAAKLEVGKNFNELWKAYGETPCRLSVSEIDQAAYEATPESQQIGYSAKINPSTGEYITYEGGLIYRKVYLDSVDGTDEYLQGDGSALIASVSEEADDIAV
jgi:hypothetical protein